ncbi:MAG: HNH endonuclease signature motif containing protein [Kofleriaceae bacterium]
MSALDWNVQVDPTFGCWLWLGAVDSDGYPIEWRAGKPLKIYRVIYEREVGPVPEGLVLDHGCSSRRCCSPAHLEPVTQTENLRRRRWAYKVRRKTCAKGHDLSINRQVHRGGGLTCRACSREWAGG